MRIDGMTPALRQALLQTLAAAKDGFQTEAADAAGQPAPVAPPPSPTANAVPQAQTSVAMLVTLASVDPAIERRRKALVQADRGVSMLEQLRDELAAGLAKPERLQELAAWTQAFEVPDDPKLAELARDIELRVRVELAKHDLTA